MSNPRISGCFIRFRLHAFSGLLDFPAFKTAGADFYPFDLSVNHGLNPLDVGLELALTLAGYLATDAADPFGQTAARDRVADFGALSAKIAYTRHFMYLSTYPN